MSSLKIVSDVPADQRTWLPLLKICVSIEHACLPPFSAKHGHRSETM
jgi:hypothetical protein